MPAERTDRPEPFLTRWSRRKLAAARDERVPASAAAAVAPPAVAAAQPAAPAAPAVTGAPPEAAALPPVESLTFESDFTAFLAPGVEPTMRQAALRKLLRDPRFNTMDGLDVYIDDYSKPSPLDPAVARTLRHAKALFDPPRTRVNAQGYVEDVPADEIEQQESQREAMAADAPQAVPLVTHDGPAVQTVPDAQSDGGVVRATPSDGEPAAS